MRDEQYILLSKDCQHTINQNNIENARLFETIFNLEQKMYVTNHAGNNWLNRF